MMGERQWFLLYVLVCLEMGIFLLLVPWSFIWERNYFLQVFPGLRDLLLEPAFRGAISGLGVANIYLGLGEIVRRRRVTADASTSLFPEGFQARSATDSGSGDQGASEGVAANPRALATHEERS